MTGQRPKPPDSVPEIAAEPKRNPVAERRAKCRREPDRPEPDVRRTDQPTDAEQQGGRRQQQRDECQRFPEGKQENNRGGPGFVDPDERQDGLVQIADGLLPVGLSKVKALARVLSVNLVSTGIRRGQDQGEA